MIHINDIVDEMTQKDLLDTAEEIAEWSNRYKKIEDFFIAQYRELIHYGGKEITVIMNNKKKISGVLTAVNYRYLQLNSSLRFYFDDIDAVILKNDKSKNNV